MTFLIRPLIIYANGNYPNANGNYPNASVIFNSSSVLSIYQVPPPGGFLVQRSIWGRAAEMGSQNQPPGITMTPYSVQKLV